MSSNLHLAHNSHIFPISKSLLAIPSTPPVPRTYNKTPQNPDTLLCHLQEKGLYISDVTAAKEALLHIGYYRFMGYAHAYRSQKFPKIFSEQTNFFDIIDLYNFDTALRFLVMRFISDFEIAFRSVICEHMARTYQDAFWISDSQYFDDLSKHQNIVSKAADAFERSRDDFATHYRNTYTNPTLPHCWILRETSTFGAWSLIYSQLANPSDKKAIAQCFTHEPISIFANWVHHLSIVRNICAHHGRLWNRVHGYSIKIPRYLSPLSFATRDKRFSSTAFVLNEFMRALSKDEAWRTELKQLVAKLPPRHLHGMGFTDVWDKDVYWR